MNLCWLAELAVRERERERGQVYSVITACSFPLLSVFVSVSTPNLIFKTVY